MHISCMSVSYIIPKQTAMKADEIRRLIINDLFLNMDDDDAEDTLERIDEYAAEVSREDAINFMIEYGDEFRQLTNQIHKAPKRLMIVGWYDAFKEQEEQC